MRPPIAPETQTLLDKLTPPAGRESTAHTDTLYAMIEPLHTAVEHLEDKLRKMKRDLRAADRAENAEYAHSFFNRFKNSIAAAEKQAADAIAALGALTDTAFQIDKYALEMNKSLDTHYLRYPANQAVQTGNDTPPSDRVTPADAEGSTEVQGV